MLLAATQPLVRHADRATLKAALYAVVGLSLASVVLTPLWLHLFVLVPVPVAIRTAAAIALRLDAVLVVGLALSAALPPIAWLAATRRFPRLGLALTLTFRQVPELARETAQIRRAQRARGLAGTGRSGLRAVVVPLMTRSLERADRQGEALVLAGWAGGRPAHPLVRNRYRPPDFLWSLLGVALFVLVFVNLT